MLHGLDGRPVVTGHPVTVKVVGQEREKVGDEYLLWVPCVDLLHIDALGPLSRLGGDVDASRGVNRAETIE